MSDPMGEKLRIDKWLWHARFFKSRALAAKAVEAGVRIDSIRASKPSRTVTPGDTLTFAQEKRIRIVRVVAIGTRRGPAPEAQTLYEDLTPPEEPRQKQSEKPGAALADAPKYDRGGRPSKRDRRQLMKTIQPPLE